MNNIAKRPAWQSPYEFERQKMRTAHELELLKDSIELRTEVVETQDDLSEIPTRNVFRAVEKNEKIAVFLNSDIGKEYENDVLFCDYLRNKEELDLFFESIDVETYIITNDMCNGHYQYGENPRGQSITVQFSVHEKLNGVGIEIIFSDGEWFTTMDNIELVGDVAESNRDAYLKEFHAGLIEHNHNLSDIMPYISNKHEVLNQFFNDSSKIELRYSREDVISIYGFDPDKYKRFATPNKAGLYSIGALRNMVSYGKPISSKKFEDIYKLYSK
jgi:hypothetical protein